MKTNRILRARGVAGWSLLGLSSVMLAGCANDYTCYDYRDCPVEGGTAEGGPKPDARGDTGSHHDGGADAKTDGKRSPDGGTDGSSGGDASDAKGDGFVCDPLQPPSTEACVISNAYGVFVSPSGSDATGMGTETAPYATVSHALSKLGSLTRVYVCNGSYVDQITVTGTVSIFGGLTCGTAADGGVTGPWTYVTGTTATIAGSSPSFVLKVNAGSAAVDLEDIELDGAAGTSASPSSIAAFATSSSNVTLRRAVLTAAAGFAGTAGTPGATGALTSTTVGGVPLATPSLNGQNATTGGGGPATVCTCSTGDVTSGGAGGDVSNAGAGQPGAPSQTTPTPATATGAGSTESECSGSNTNGSNGSAAVPIAAADGIASSLGTLDDTGWTPGSGGAAANGAPGQGGGGGGGVLGGNGGGGACGGCGGLGGGIGTGGGASVALLAFNSPVQLFSATLTAESAGKGGTGASGGTGIAGGTSGNRTGSGCNGGNGGPGSTGGAGAGGAGGVSIGILYQGGTPVPDTTTMITPGSFGSGGTGGNPGSNDGVTGVSATTQNAASL